RLPAGDGGHRDRHPQGGGRGRLLLARSVHACILSGLRRGVVGVVEPTRETAAPGAERRPLLSPRWPAATCRTESNGYGTADQNGGTPHLARGRDDRASRTTHQRTTRRRHRGVGRRRPADTAVAAVPPCRPDGHVELCRRWPGLRLDRGG